MLAPWQSDYETGNSQIDAEHQDLFQLINDLGDAISRGASQTDLKQMLDKLIAHTTEHFQSEENLVRNLSFRRFDIHSAGHENFLHSLSKVSRKFGRDPAYLTIEVVESLKEKILKHVVEEDLPMVESLNLTRKVEAKAI